jgi:hypothetical protein
MNSRLKVEWLVQPRLKATTAHAYTIGGNTSICGLMWNADHLLAAHPADRRCRFCLEKTTKEPGLTS